MPVDLNLLDVLTDENVRAKVLAAIDNDLTPAQLEQVTRALSPERTWYVRCAIQVRARTAGEAIEKLALFADDTDVCLVKDPSAARVPRLELAWLNLDVSEDEVTVV